MSIPRAGAVPAFGVGSAISCSDCCETPLGPLAIRIAESGELLALRFGSPEPGARIDRRRCAEVRRQLEEYFLGKRRRFELRLAPSGSPFQRRVWQALLDIPYGQTVSYGFIARRIRGSPRAVGRANAANPLPIVIPCHRVVGSDGALTGYGGGLERKRRLLELEGALTRRLI